MDVTIKQLSVQEFAELINTGNAPLLLDVREPWEVGFAALANSLNIPMNQVPERLDELPKDSEILIMCHHGGRSQSVAQFLSHNGYSKISNLLGGIHAWSTEIDSDIPTY